MNMAGFETSLPDVSLTTLECKAIPLTPEIECTLFLVICGEIVRQMMIPRNTRGLVFCVIKGKKRCKLTGNILLEFFSLAPDKIYYREITILLFGGKKEDFMLRVI
jgi:hypothetical protein